MMSTGSREVLREELSRTCASEIVAKVDEELTPMLLRYLQRLAGDRATAEDLLQETLLRVTKGAEGFDGRSSVKTWVFAIATRVAADYLRNPGRRAQIVDVDEADDRQTLADSADEQLISGEMNACIREVIGSLPEDYRSALVLHEFEEMSAAQIAEVLECSLATAKIRIHRGRARLREALRQGCDFYRDRDDSLQCDRKQGPR